MVPWLAAVTGVLFLIAAVGKVDAWPEWTELSRKLSGHRSIAAGIAFGLPLAEGAVAVTCVVEPRLGLAAAAALLAALACGVLIAHRRAGAAACNCFGAIAPGELGPRLALRNGALALIAGTGSRLATSHGDVSLLTLLSVVSIGALVVMSAELFRLQLASS